MNSMDVFLRRAKAALDQPKDDCLTVVFRGLTSDEKREIIEAVHMRHGARRSLRRRPARHEMAHDQDLNDGNDGGPVMLAADMSMRDYLAAQFAAAMMTATSADHDYPNIQREVGGPTIAERVATIAYRMADAMLKAREASNEQ